MRRIIREFSFEIGILFLVFTGVFLLYEKVSLRSILRDAVIRVYEGGKNGLTALSEGIPQFFMKLSLSDWIGLFLLIAAITLAFWSARRRFLRSDLYRSSTCPDCGAKLHRIHRSSFDRFLGKLLFLPLHRYRCENRECGWAGLRKPGRQHRRKQSGVEEAAQ